MSGKRQDLLLDEATTAWRPRDRFGCVAAHPAFEDLDAVGRAQLHAVVEQQRLLEMSIDPEGLSTTARAVLARIRGGGRA